MNNYRVFFLILLQSAHIFSCSNIELYQDFITNYTKQAQQAEERLVELRRCKDEQALEASILEVHPQSPYEKLIPHESYKALNISRYANNNEIASSLSKLKNAPDAKIDQLDKAYENIHNHRNIKLSYIKLINELNKIPYLKENFITSEHSINQYAHLPKHINQDNCIANYIKNRALHDITTNLSDVIKSAQEIKKEDDEITQDIKNRTCATAKILVVCGVVIIIIPAFLPSSRIVDKSFDI